MFIKKKERQQNAVLKRENYIRFREIILHGIYGQYSRGCHNRNRGKPSWIH